MSRKLKVLLPLVVVAVAVVMAVVLVKAAPEPETREPETPPPLVRAIAVEPRDVRLDVHSQGTVRPRTEATLTAQVAGRIVEVAPSFAEGGLFREGQALVRIDPRDYELAVAQAESQVAQAEVRLVREEAEAEVAREEWRELGPDAGAAGEPSPLVLREPQLAEARAAVEAAEAAVRKARLDLSRTTVEAPFDGRVRQKKADVGQSVSPGAPLAAVYAVDYAEVRLPVPVAELEYLDLDLLGETPRGPDVALSAELAGGRRIWRARVVRTAGGIDPETRMLPVIARVDRPYAAAAREAPSGDGVPLPVGLFVDAEIAGRTAEGVFVLPRSALRESARWRQGKPGTVLVAEEPDPADRDDEPARLRFREVAILRLTGDEAVISSGLEPGDRVVVSPLETPTDGMAVRVEEVELPAGELPGPELTLHPGAVPGEGPVEGPSP